MRIGPACALALLTVVALPAGAEPPACASLRYEQIATWEPFVCIHIEGTVSCPAASARGYVSDETSGGTCSPEREALYTFTLPPEVTSVAQVHYTRDLELLFIVTGTVFAQVGADTVLGVGLKHGQPFRLVRGADFGIPPDGVQNVALAVTVQQTRAFTAQLAQTTAGGFRASLVVEPPVSVLRVSRARR